MHCRLSSSGYLALDHESGGDLFTIFQISEHPLGGIVVTGMAEGHPVIDHWWPEGSVDPLLAELATVYRYVPIFSASVPGVPFSHLAPDSSDLVPLSMAEIVRFAIKAGWASAEEAPKVRAYVSYAWRFALRGDDYAVRLPALPFSVPTSEKPARWCRSATFSSPGSYPMLQVRGCSRRARIGTVGDLTATERRAMALAADSKTLGTQLASTPEYRIWLASSVPSHADVANYTKRAIGAGLTVEEAARAASFVPNYRAYYGIVPEYGRKAKRAIATLYTPIPRPPLVLPSETTTAAGFKAAISANGIGLARTSGAVSTALAESRAYLEECRKMMFFDD